MRSVGHTDPHRRERSFAAVQPSSYRLASVSDHAVAWRLRRNCSVTPRQLAGVYAMLCLVSLTIAFGFWLLGARMVLGFAGLELLALAAAFLVYARHAADGETLVVQGGRLTVERELAGRREVTEFVGVHVTVGLPAGDADLVALQAQGRRLDVGRHVRPEWRPQLASELRAALAAAPWCPGRAGDGSLA